MLAEVLAECQTGDMSKQELFAALTLHGTLREVSNALLPRTVLTRKHASRSIKRIPSTPDRICTSPSVVCSNDADVPVCCRLWSEAYSRDSSTTTRSATRPSPMVSPVPTEKATAQMVCSYAVAKQVMLVVQYLHREFCRAIKNAPHHKRVP